MEWRSAVEILKIARDSGMQVILDGRIGREEYRSVVGSVQALQRFAEALCKSIILETQGFRVRAEESDLSELTDDLEVRGG
jgi:hypothetical protein